MDVKRRRLLGSALTLGVTLMLLPGCTLLTDIDEITADDVPCPVQPDGLTACGDPLYTQCVLPGAGGQLCVEIDHCASPPPELCPNFEFWQCVPQVGAMPICQDIDECEDSPCPEDQVCVNRLDAPPDCWDAIWVSANRGDDETQGTRSNPLETIQEALTRVEAPNVAIALEPGTYAGAIRVDGQESLAIVGVGGDVVITGPSGEDRNVVIVNSWNVLLSNVQLEGGSTTALLVRDTTDLVVQNVEMVDVGREPTTSVAIVDVANTVGLVLQNLDIRDFGTTPGSFSAVWIRDSGDVAIRNTAITGPADGSASAVGNADGILAQRTAGLSIDRTTISNLRGGDGSEATSQRGGSGLGIETSGSGLAISNVTITNINGGNGGSGGRGGEAMGLRVAGSGIVRQVSVRQTIGGDSLDQSDGDGGVAQGIVIQGPQPAALSNAAVWNVVPGRGAPGRADANCVLVQDALESATIEHLSCLDIDGRGVRFVRASGSVSSSIISKINGECLEATGEVEEGVPAAFTLDSTMLFSCTPSSDVVIGADPLFRDEQGGDLHLRPGSPAIDAGSADSAGFRREPKPNGCAVNLGAYGGTSEATSMPTASHCP